MANDTDQSGKSVTLCDRCRRIIEQDDSSTTSDQVQAETPIEDPVALAIKAFDNFFSHDDEDEGNEEEDE